MQVLNLILTVFTLSIALVGASHPTEEGTECAGKHEYCGVFHDRVMHQYRGCCGGRLCSAFDYLDRTVSDVRCK
ncbi:hypothetical protein C8R43DRAFT_1126322 [Mycena crocata]|nr:hypothetical protein C8R43DRAFT_1126322 [Mycena crocata]